MAIKFVRLKAPPEFRDWLTQRQTKMNNLATNLGLLKKKKRIPLMNVMRIVSKTDGITIDEEMLRKFSIKR
jgi:hypothetical protein